MNVTVRLILYNEALATGAFKAPALVLAAGSEATDSWEGSPASDMQGGSEDGEPRPVIRVPDMGLAAGSRGSPDSGCDPVDADLVCPAFESLKQACQMVMSSSARGVWVHHSGCWLQEATFVEALQGAKGEFAVGLRLQGLSRPTGVCASSTTKVLGLLQGHLRAVSWSS